MSAIKNVVIAGATGALGSLLAKQVIDSGLFNVTVFKRSGSTSTATFPDSVKVVEVDYTSVESLQAALAGQDAVVSTLATLAVDTQKPLIDAAVAAGVKRFLPSEYGCDLENTNTRAIPIFAGKVAVEEYLQEKAKTTELTYTFLYTSAFLDWGLQNNFIIDLTSATPRIINDGNLVFSSTSLSTIGDAVVGVLTHPEETKNRAVRVQDLQITQNKLLDIARKVYPEKKWEPVSANLEELYAGALSNLSKGIVDHPTIVSFLYRGLLDPAYGGAFQNVDNELLGLKTKGEDFIVETIKAHLK
jgi:uncharacterized protein YbjT (DUF2867 family)